MTESNCMAEWEKTEERARKRGANSVAIEFHYCGYVLGAASVLRAVQQHLANGINVQDVLRIVVSEIEAHRVIYVHGYWRGIWSRKYRCVIGRVWVQSHTRRRALPLSPNGHPR